MAEPSAYEQYLFELINRDRLDPGAALTRIQEHPTWTVDYKFPMPDVPASGSQPLAWNTALADTAARGVDPGPLDMPLGVSIFGPLNTAAHLDPIADSLFAHRTATLLDPSLKEAGLDLSIREWTVANLPDDPWTGTSVVSIDGQLSAAAPAGGVFLTGVAFNDADADRFYDPGEGLGGVKIAAAGASTATWSAGGYALGVQAGTLAVEISGPGIAKPMQVDVTVHDTNVKLDVLGDGAIAASADLTLGDTVRYAKLLGEGAYRVQVGDHGATVHGNRSDNVLIGGDGDDRFNGGGGRDYMEGGNGNDFYVVDSMDTVVEHAGGGTDTIATTHRHFSIPTNIENVNLIGAEPQQVIGNALDNVVVGNDWTNAITGGLGNDVLDGKGGDDGLAGGAGHDTLIGGGGADRFIFTPNAAAGVDIIRDFDFGEGDRIDLTAYRTNGDHVHAEQHGTATDLFLDGTKFAVLLDTAAGAFTSDWIL